MARFAVLNSFLSKSYQFLVAREMWSERSYVGFLTNDQVHVTVNSDTSNHCLIIHVFSVRRWVIPDCIVFFHMGTVKDKRYIALIRHAALIWGQSIRIHCISRTTQYSVINKRKSGQIYSRISIIHALRFTFATWTKLGPYRRYYSRMILPENQIKQSGPH